MDYIWIGIRTFTYVIIFTLIKIIVPKLLGNVKYKNSVSMKFLLCRREWHALEVLKIIITNNDFIPDSAGKENELSPSVSLIM